MACCAAPQGWSFILLLLGPALSYSPPPASPGALAIDSSRHAPSLPSMPPPAPLAPPVPPSSPPLPPPDVTIAFTLTAEGELDAYDNAVVGRIVEAIAAQASIDPAAVTVTVTAGSVLISVRIVIAHEESTTIQNSLAQLMVTPAAATSMLSAVQLASGGSVVVTSTTTPVIEVNSPQRGGNNQVRDIVAVSVGLGILLAAVVCLMYCSCVGSYLCATQPCMERARERYAKTGRFV